MFGLPPTANPTASANLPPQDLRSEIESSLAERVTEAVTSNLKTQLVEILAERDGNSSAVEKEMESLKAAQQHASLLSEAAEFQSESAQRQFIAFAKKLELIVGLF